MRLLIGACELLKTEQHCNQGQGSVTQSDNLPSRVPQQATLPTNIHFEGITWNHQSLQ